MGNPQLRGTPFQITSSGTVSANATLNAAAGTTPYVTDISGSSDIVGAVIQIKDNGTTVWQAVVAATVFSYESFSIPIKITLGSTLSAQINGTNLAKINLGGYTLP